MKGGRSVSVVFVGSNWPSEHKWKVAPHQSLLDCVKQYFIVPPEELISRILSSFIPPFMGDVYRQVHVDFLGPSLAVMFMAILLNYGHALKLPSAVASMSPTVFLISYIIFMPLVAYILGRVGRASVTFTEMTALLGYGMFGHIFTLVASLALYDEQSNLFFFLSLIIFGGLSTLRVSTVLLASIPLPVARLTVCSLVASLQLLSLIFVHFAYMHKTFVYGGGKLQMGP